METYKNLVDKYESNLAPYAMKSFESTVFVDGSELFEYYEKTWNDNSTNFKLTNRTPIQHQRDRILYSNGLRKLSERYHVLYCGEKRIIRNYITHTMRLAHVAKSICRALNLNEDFAEGIVLGSKVGALPFVHASKETVSTWVMKKVGSLDLVENQKNSNKNITLPFVREDHLPGYPQWIRSIANEKIKDDVEKFMPFAKGKMIDPAHSSGQQGYWMLSTNPYTLESIEKSFTPELLYGIWRHSLNTPMGKDSFSHEQKILTTGCSHKIEWSNITFEAIVVQYADDITWVIENLNDAHNALMLNNQEGNGLFFELFKEVRGAPQLILEGLSEKDSGKLYSYFINDLIKNSQSVLSRVGGIESKQYLKNGNNEVVIGLSATGIEMLGKFKSFLIDRVFTESRVHHRKKMLEALTDGCMDLIFDKENNGEFLKKFIKIKGGLESWTLEQNKVALKLLDHEIHRIQLAVNIFSEFGDQEIFSFVGMESI